MTLFDIFQENNALITDFFSSIDTTIQAIKERDND